MERSTQPLELSAELVTQLLCQVMQRVQAGCRLSQTLVSAAVWIRTILQLRGRCQVFKPGSDPSARSVSRDESVKLVFSVGAHSRTSRTV